MRFFSRSVILTGDKNGKILSNGNLGIDFLNKGNDDMPLPLSDGIRVFPKDFLGVVNIAGPTLQRFKTPLKYCPSVKPVQGSKLFLSGRIASFSSCLHQKNLVNVN
jgi:hypothetical protein